MGQKLSYPVVYTLSIYIKSHSGTFEDGANLCITYAMTSSSLLRCDNILTGTHFRESQSIYTAKRDFLDYFKQKITNLFTSQPTSTKTSASMITCLTGKIGHTTQLPNHYNLHLLNRHGVMWQGTWVSWLILLVSCRYERKMLGYSNLIVWRGTWWTSHNKPRQWPCLQHTWIWLTILNQIH